MSPVVSLAPKEDSSSVDESFVVFLPVSDFIGFLLPTLLRSFIRWLWYSVFVLLMLVF